MQLQDAGVWEMSKRAFGLDFVVVNQVRQVLPCPPFYGGPWVHLATVKRGLKEYMAFHKYNEHKVYIEELDITEPGLLKYIEDDVEFADLYRFLMSKGLLLINPDEMLLDKMGLPGTANHEE